MEDTVIALPPDADLAEVARTIDTALAEAEKLQGSVFT